MLRLLLVPALSLLAAACGDGAEGLAEAPRARTLVLGAYTTPQQAYEDDIIPAFQARWRETTGEEVRFQTSYLGSGAQSRAIVGGFEADVAALSLEADVTRIQDAGLITHDWKAGPHHGMVTDSVAVIAVRTGNPKGIQDWADLQRADVEVLTPNPRTSGGAMWNVAAIYGAVTRGHSPAPAGDPAAAESFLGGILARVKIMDKGARESMITFEKGVGDAAITYENEVLSARLAGQQYDYVVPASSILIENPVAVIDTHADRHGVRDLAEGFVAFLYTPEAQRIFAKHGYRPIDPTVAEETAGVFPPVPDLFTIRDLGDWPQVTADLFGQGALFDRAMTRAGGQR